MKNILELTLSELEEVITNRKQPRFSAGQIFDWIYKKGAIDFRQMSNLSTDLRSRLTVEFSIFDIEEAKHLISADATEKFLFRLKDANFIEAVIIPTQNRVTGCVSTQVGCKFACKFCASGLLGFKRNLSVSEIVQQVLYLEKKSVIGLNNLVFMGIGEPLDNYDNVLKAIRILNAAWGLRLGARKITISTSGIIPGIKRLMEEKLQIELSISLHAADDKTRNTIMPANKKYPLSDLMTALKEYIRKTNRQVTFEYVLIEGLNSDLQHARSLVKLLKGLNCKINLIPCNHVKELNLNPPGKLAILMFKDLLVKAGINTTFRVTRGRDIEAACGQLRLHSKKWGQN